MGYKRLLLLVVCALSMVVRSVPSRAMSLPHYDLDSLTFLSTDIVIADVAKIPGTPGRLEDQFVATVQKTLSGPLRPGAELDRLSSLFLYDPMADGQRVILFLRDHHQKLSNLDPESTEPRYELVHSGVYLVDSHELIHEYYQWNNPGLYIAEGFGFDRMRAIEKGAVPQFLSLVEAQIGLSLNSTRAIHNLLDRATPQKIPPLINLLEARRGLGAQCGWQARDAVAEQLTQRLASFSDRELMLRIYPIADSPIFDLWFITPIKEEREPNANQIFQEKRFKYLVETLSTASADQALRCAAAQVLLSLRGWSKWPAGLTDEILAAAKLVFDDDSQDGLLRALCVQLLSPDKPEIVADMKQVYSRTHSSDVHFAIEESFLSVSDALYESLSPPGGPVASVVREASKERCFKQSANKIVFVSVSLEERQFGPRNDFNFVVTSADTGQRLLVTEAQGTGSSISGTTALVELDQPSELAPGTYNLALEYRRGDKLLSRGYPLKLSVAATPAGNMIRLLK